VKEKRNMVIGGAIIGILAVVAVFYGNPKNMGICVACFIRDSAGALGLHKAAVVQYLRPELIGMLLGAFLIAVCKKEYSSKGGSSPLIRFCLGFIVMIGALMFLGCPTRMVLRLAGGDLNALVGLVGFALGIWLGIIFLKKGFTLKRNYKQSQIQGYIYPIINVILFILLITSSSLLIFSTEGPGSMHAPIWISLGIGLIVGVILQRTRLCMVGGMRDLFLFKDSYMLLGFLAMLVAAFVANFAFGFFKLGFAEQPIAHTDGLWNFLGMALVGWASTLLGGCPMRQVILSGEGNADSVITIMGMLLGAAFAHNFGLASSAEGPTLNGQIAVIAGFVVLLLISVMCIAKSTSSNKEAKEIA
jgi:YedE family putative selenium metabolism protein